MSVEESTCTGGGAFKGRPIRKCPAVRAVVPSDSVASSGIIGWELRIASASIRTVFNSSKERGHGDINFRKSTFIDFTPASQSPPKCGALGGERCH